MYNILINIYIKTDSNLKHLGPVFQSPNYSLNNYSLNKPIQQINFQIKQKIMTTVFQFKFIL